MAGRKKSSPVPPSDGARAFAVVVEQLRGEFKVFGEVEVYGCAHGWLPSSIIGHAEMVCTRRR